MCRNGPGRINSLVLQWPVWAENPNQNFTHFKADSIAQLENYLYLDLLDNQGNEDESKHGHLLVLSRQGWQMEMAKEIGKAQVAKCDAPAAANNMHTAKWKLTMLAALFGSQCHNHLA